MGMKLVGIKLVGSCSGRLDRNRIETDHIGSSRMQCALQQLEIAT